MTSDGTNIKHILLVEDSLDQANLVRRWLEASGRYQVTTVQDGLHGSSLAQERRWALIITDINLPGSDGIEVVRAAKALQPETPVLVTTAYRDQSYSARALEAGADGFLHKPLQQRELVERAEELVLSGGTAQHGGGPTILAVGAHPDDVESGCGGILLRHLDQGHRVVILVLTSSEDDGSKSERLGEAELAARLMGSRVVFTDLPAGLLGESEESEEAVSRVVEAFDPDVVYVHSPNDKNPDHRAAFAATVKAVTKVPSIYCYQSSSSTVAFRPSRFVEISEYLARKKQILALYQTPDRNRPYLKPAFIEASAIYWSRFAGYRRVEALEVVRAPKPRKVSTVAHDPAYAV